MATNKAKRSIHLAQPERRSPHKNPEQILRPRNGLRISSAGSQPHQTRLHARKAAQPAELMPVKAHVYYAIAELNAGLEKAIQNLQNLQHNHLFRASGLTAMNRSLREIRARANRELMMALNERETANAAQFQQTWP